MRTSMAPMFLPVQALRPWASRGSRRGRGGRHRHMNAVKMRPWVATTMERPMRFFLAAVTIALLTLPAHAQGMGGGRRHQPAPEQKKDETKRTVSDKDYKAALDKIPNSNEKPDPWGNVRAAPKSK